jgi:formiminotetrahydrofolate cyclodeaminase
MEMLFRNLSVKAYCDILAQRTPFPGGGSAAALCAALGVSLLSMAAEYSLGRGSAKRVERRIRTINQRCEKLRHRLLELVDEDADAYRQVVQTRKAPARVKRAALARARKVPLEIGKHCYLAIELAPYLIEKGNLNLLSDVEVAGEFLLAAFNSAMINVAVNQG